MTRACKENGCALLGGETAEMPGFYRSGDYELVGFIVGLVDRPALIDGSRIRAGDVLLGLPSAGLHTNGYSLARRVFFDVLGLEPDDPIPGLDDGKTVGQHLLDPHLTYLPALLPLLGRDSLHGLAHITGGGLTDNVPRILPDGLRARVDRSAWEVPGVFRAIEEHGQVGEDEMYRVFNMGIGMVLVIDGTQVDADEAELVRSQLNAEGHAATVIGRVERGDGGVVYDEDQETEG